MKLTHLTEMLALQDTLNSRVDADWRTRGNRWTRAIMIEGAEALEHYGWKWWKQQTTDMPQVHLELVDIWHFILSYAIEHFESPADYIANSIVVTDDKLEFLTALDVRMNFEKLIAGAAMGEIAFSVFVALMKQTGLTWDMLYETYVGKNVLNMFRQDHGYKKGTYIKDWDGVEDNVVLAGLMDVDKAFDGIMKDDQAGEPGSYASRLYALLESIYAHIPRLRAVA